MEKYTNPDIFKSFNPSGEIIVALGIIFVLIILTIIVIIRNTLQLRKRTILIREMFLYYLMQSIL